MNPERVTARGLQFRQAIAGWLPGFQVQFNKQSRDHPECGHANLVVAAGGSTYGHAGRAEGVLYELSSDSMIFRMDPFERAPINYSREQILVCSANGPIATWTYFATPALLRDNLLPSRVYLDHLLAGKPFLSADYYAALARQPVSD